MPLEHAAYLLGALKELLASREMRIIDTLVMHADANQLEATMMYQAVARISELRGLKRDLEREARHEVDRMGRGEGHGSS